MQEMDAQKAKYPNGLNLPYIKGDSYPTITSRPPSVPDPDQRTDDRSIDLHNKSQRTRRTALPGSKSSNRQPLGQAYAASSAETRPNGNIAASDLVVRPDESKSDSLEQHAASGFMYQKALKHQMALRPPGGSRQKSAPSAISSMPGVSTNTAQPASAPAQSDTSQRSLQGPPSGTIREQAVLPPHKSDMVPTHTKTERHEPKREQIFGAAPEYEDFSDAADTDVPHGAHPNGHVEDAHNGTAVELDYEAPELFAMEYQDLKTQPFDIDPNAGEFTLPTAQQDDSLVAKLSTVSSFPKSDQSHFFASLDLDEWEQAGEWFLDRFSEIFNKLKDARQEMRKAARAFETEVEQRHGAIGKKRKQIEDALGEMKESGGKVLQGTPKKAKTK